jgi:hypothetical protein
VVGRNPKRVADTRTAQGVPSATPEWLSVSQMQDLLGIGHTKAYSLVASDEIPGW